MPLCNITVAAMVHPLPEEKGKRPRVDTPDITKQKKIVHSTPIDYDSIEIDTSVNSKKNNRLRKEVNMPRSLHQIIEMEEISSIRDVTTETSQLRKVAEVELPELETDNNIPQLQASKKFPEVEYNNDPQSRVSKRLFSSGSSTDEEIKPLKVVPRKQKASRSNKENRPKYKKTKSNRTKPKPLYTLDTAVRDHVHDGYESLHSDDGIIKKKVTKHAPRKYTERPLHFKSPPFKSPASSGVLSSLPELEVEKDIPYSFKLYKGLTDSEDSPVNLNAFHFVEPPAKKIEAVNPIMELNNTQTFPIKPIETENPIVECNNSQYSNTDLFSQETRKIVWLNTTDLHKEINLEPPKEVEEANLQNSAKSVECVPSENIRIIESNPNENTGIIEEVVTNTILQNEENSDDGSGQNIKLYNRKTKVKYVGHENIMSWIATGAPPDKNAFFKEFVENYILVYANNIKMHLDKLTELDDPSTSKYYDILMKDSHLISKYLRKR